MNTASNVFLALALVTGFLWVVQFAACFVVHYKLTSTAPANAVEKVFRKLREDQIAAAAGKGLVFLAGPTILFGLLSLAFWLVS